MNHRQRGPRYYKSNVDVHELCIWMFEQLKESPPFMITSRDFSREVTDLIEDAVHNKPLSAVDLHWSVLLDGLYVDGCQPTTFRTSAKVFHFLASLGEALHDTAPGGIRASLEKLLELSIGYQDEDRVYLQFEGTSRNWRITTTPLGERAFGQPVEICFRTRFPLDGFILESLPIEGTEAANALAGPTDGDDPPPTTSRLH